MIEIVWLMLTDSDEPWRQDCRLDLRLHSSSDGPGQTFLHHISMHVIVF